MDHMTPVRRPAVAVGVAVFVAAVTPVAAAMAVATPGAHSPREAQGPTAVVNPQPRVIQPSAPTSKRIPGTKCRAFPASNAWHADISALPVHPRSAQWLASTDADNTNLHPDFGPSFGEQPVPYGIPITVVKSKKKPSKKVRFGYADESDNVRYPLSRKTKIEGGWNAGGDRHAIVIR